MVVRFRDESEMRSYGLVIDPADPTRALSAKPAEKCPTVGQKQTLHQLIVTAREQWVDIQQRDKYLTGQYWGFAGILQRIKDACGKDIHAWATAYRAIGLDRRRASELLLYRQLFADRQAAAECTVGQANRLIRRAKRIARAAKQESAAKTAQQERLAGGHEGNGNSAPPPLERGDCGPCCLSLDQIKHAITTLAERDLDVLHRFIAEIIGRRTASTMNNVHTCASLEDEAMATMGNVVWEEV